MKTKLFTLLLVSIPSLITVNAEILTAEQAIDSVMYNIAENDTSEMEYIVEGYVIEASQYNMYSETQSWYLVDDTTNHREHCLSGIGLVWCWDLLEVTNCNIVNEADTVKVVNGDKVRVTGKLKHYVRNSGIHRPQIILGTANIIEKTDGNHTINRDVPNISITQALNICRQLANKELSEQQYWVTGVVTSMVTTYGSDGGLQRYGSQQYWISDFSQDSLYVYKSVANREIVVGDIISVMVQLKNGVAIMGNYVPGGEAETTVIHPQIGLSSNYPNMGRVQRTIMLGDSESVIIEISAESNYGYHFIQWSDGSNENPRTIELTQDTTFIAEFSENSYHITTEPSKLERGTTSGDTTALYLDEVVITAIPNYGYHFTQWSDGSTENPKTITVTKDETYKAFFDKNTYLVNLLADHGTFLTKGCVYNKEYGHEDEMYSYYLNEVTITAVPNYGYHFTQWSDGKTANPRTFILTQDTTFTAEFAYDRVGTCGKDLALVWSYDPTNKVLTIGNAGSFTENMQFGVEAPNEMEELVIGNSVTAIGANAFAGISSLKKVSIGESVKTIGEQAFFNCVNLETIFNYRPTPTNAYSTAFDGVDKFECVLYVLPSSIDMYKNASVWRDFYYTYAIGAKEATVTTNDVKVEPQTNAATVTWPTSENAASYTIQITKDGVVFCTLIFNGNGQLTGIAFAPSRDGQAHAPAATKTANGLQFTVTGLDSGTHYALTLQAKDSQETVLASYSSEFTTTGDEGIEDVQGNDVHCTKVLINGTIFILRGEKVYNAQGALVK